MTEYARIELFPVVVEGAIDYFCGRPREKNPYSPTYASNEREAWFWGWDDAEYLLAVRGEEEATRWLADAA
jgi:hypothetical protein